MPGVTEVLHARMTSHVYPMHTHEAWTLLIVDDGSIRYDLHRSEHGAVARAVTLLPPQVPHNGRAAVPSGPVRQGLGMIRDRRYAVYRLGEVVAGSE